MRRSILFLFAACAGLVGCSDSTVAPLTGPAQSETPTDLDGLSGPGTPAASHASGGATYHQQLAALRRATAPFHNFQKAEAAGYGAQLTPCLEQLPDGAQGYHYGNPALIDGAVNLLEPEILQYEPQPGGHLRLVGVEYIVPLTEPEPAPLLGQHFHANPAAGIWGLHVWLWRHNPSGMFADWNPKVSCEHAS